MCKRHPDSRQILRARGGTSTRCAQCTVEAVRRHQRRVKATLVEEAGGGCIICGYNRCPAALHFHHRNPINKVFQVGVGNKSLARQRIEAAKCDLLCANCHAERHYKE